jgi:hypothetical protein
MIPIFAADAPDPTFFSNWIGVLFYLFIGVGSGIGALAAWRTFNPSPTRIKQPLRVQEEVEFATVERVEKVEAEVGLLRVELRDGFEGLRTDRSRSTGNLHERIEEMDSKAGARTEDLRKEIKNDMRGVHDRINEVLAAVSAVQSSVTVCQGIHLQKK